LNNLLHSAARKDEPRLESNNGMIIFKTFIF